MKKTKEQNNTIIKDKDKFQKPISKPKAYISPNETLYVNNINEKIKIDLLRENLYYLFSQFGDVLEINARKSKKMRGQAFIVYKDINEATRAKVSLNNFLFLGSRINVDYAKAKSDIIVKIKGQTNNANNEEYKQTGTYISRKRKRMTEYENNKDNDEDESYESVKEEKNKIDKKEKENEVEEKDKLIFNKIIDLNEDDLDDIDGEEL